MPPSPQKNDNNKKTKTRGGTSLALQIPQPMIFDLNDMPAVCFGHLFPPSALKTVLFSIRYKQLLHRMSLITRNAKEYPSMTAQ